MKKNGIGQILRFNFDPDVVRREPQHNLFECDPHPDVRTRVEYHRKSGTTCILCYQLPRGAPDERLNHCLEQLQSWCKRHELNFDAIELGWGKW